ncbi:FtsW/RodA/SpoVE family cell cycle protein [Pseudoscardovia radai]|uniref:FtsW/RodA/SpoVE family cell cycle protein n=1 Tax=Pseudoscardovia radai TaxID=987066 RepID=UPI00399302A9
MARDRRSSGADGSRPRTSAPQFGSEEYLAARGASRDDAVRDGTSRNRAGRRDTPRTSGASSHRASASRSSQSRSSAASRPSASRAAFGASSHQDAAAPRESWLRRTFRSLGLLQGGQGEDSRNGADDAPSPGSLADMRRGASADRAASTGSAADGTATSLYGTTLRGGPEPLPASVPWPQRCLHQFRHCLDRGDDDDFQPVSTASYRGWRFFLNPVYCYNGFIAAVVALTLFGVIMVYSSSSVELVSQGVSPIKAAISQLSFAALGFVAALLFAIPNETIHLVCCAAVVLGSAILQALTFFIGVEYNGNKGWIRLGPLQFQPAELLKVGVCVMLPVLLYNAVRSRDPEIKVNWAVPLVFSAAALGLVFLGRDMGTAMIVLIICLCALIAAGIPRKALYWLFGGGAGVLAIGVMANSSRLSRILVVVNGCNAEDSQGLCYQVIHGIYALSSGGVTGVGIGNSHEKWNYLPEAESDFIFAIIGEEVGFIGALSVIVLFMLIAWCLFVLALNHPHFIGSMTILCVMFWFIPQALINIAVVLGVFPVTGLPLPFLSSGGSSLISCLAASGVVIYEARRIPAVRAATRRG